MFLGNGYSEEAIQRNIRMMMNRWEDGEQKGQEQNMDMSGVLRIGSKATTNSIEIKLSYNPEGKDNPLHHLAHTT
ncbi:unnamed protein product [Protopolystoma xenopodis]|uniref:Uncharacterized protein n=1 Tax=Protopolystoma xenopodis TaxID=117903 RepID=A0A448WBW4_9PLAT|nr:unnamed protein product [Protopolystoma xenopodis]